MSSTTSNINPTSIVSMIITLISIVAIGVVKANFFDETSSSDAFVPFVQNRPAVVPSKAQQHAYLEQRNVAYPYRQPFDFDQQIYNAKNPYYKDMGRQCDQNTPNSCGVMGRCQNGICSPVQYSRTAFGVPL